MKIKMPVIQGQPLFRFKEPCGPMLLRWKILLALQMRCKGDKRALKKARVEAEAMADGMGLK